MTIDSTPPSGVRPIGDGTDGTLLRLRRGESTGRHAHPTRHEMLTLMSGAALLTVVTARGPRVTMMSPGGTYAIAAGTVHSVVALHDAEIVELAADPGAPLCCD